MNISNFRNSYLIDKAYRLTLLSVTLTALAPLIDAGRRALFEQPVGQRCFHRSECGATFSQRSERANDDM